MSNYWGFIIDTDQYSGNFHREMCEWLTGYTEEIGDDESTSLTDRYLKYEDRLLMVQNDQGYTSPNDIYETPGWYNTGMGICYRQGEEKQALALHAKEVIEYHTPIIDRTTKILHDLYAGVSRSNWSTDAALKEIKRCEDRIEEANCLLIPARYPAYMSVVIYFHEQPTSDMIDDLKNRATSFVSSWGPKVNITGFRLVNFKSTATESVI